uniref:Uncharacterized protein n=1 Tax=Rhizophora mucronata TaxID=61149 RepID=A0A2P2P2H1_RHIMU
MPELFYYFYLAANLVEEAFDWLAFWFFFFLKFLDV